MSLFSSIQMGANTLLANGIALQVVGQNIANANTPGYIREEVVFAPAPTQRRGDLLLGLGVEVEAVVQKIDNFLEERLRGAVSERADAEAQESTYLELEAMIGEFSDTDLSTSLNNFFGSIAEVLNDPGSVPNRNLAVLQGVTLAGDINRLTNRTTEIRSGINDRVIDMAENINRLIEEIRDLNIRITTTEGGDVSNSDAVGLRDQRLVALEDLAKLINIRVKEQPSGGVVVYCGGDYLVFEGVAREVEVVLDSDRGLSAANVHFVGTDSPLDPSAGELAGLLAARDEIMGGFFDRLDEFAKTLAFEFNKVYSRGQGLKGFQELTSESAVDDVELPLNAAGLEFTPVNGSFQVVVRNTQTLETQTTDIIVNLDGLGDEFTLDGTNPQLSLVAALDAIEGISAQSTPGRKLTITSDSSNVEFTFADDTSGLLAALGLNTFFSGSTARDLGVSEVLREDPARFAASLGGIGVDVENAEELAAFLDRQIESQNGASLAILYDRMTAETTQSSSVNQAVAEGARVFEQTLRGQKMATSGVGLDEEVVRMMAFQRTYQTTARYMATLSELLEILASL